MPVSREKVIAKFLELGTMADEVANNLELLDIQGGVGEPTDCPLARYAKLMFEDELEDDEEINIGMSQIVVDGVTLKRKGAWHPGLEESELPDHIWDFISRFDDNKYPGLVEYNNEEDEEEEEDFDSDFDDDDDEYDDYDSDQDLEDEEDDEEEDEEEEEVEEAKE